MIYNYYLKIASGMSFVTEKRKMFHGNLCASNILLTDNLGVKISYFGSSKDLCNNTNIDMKKCNSTIRWMSPEALSMKRSSSKADVWSFGVVLWEVFTLAQLPPYRGKYFSSVK